MDIGAVGSSGYGYAPPPEAIAAVSEALADGSGAVEELLEPHAQDFAMEAGVKVASLVMNTIKLNDEMLMKLIDTIPSTVDLRV